MAEQNAHEPNIGIATSRYGHRRWRFTGLVMD